jgi:hypothetical protein
VNLLFYPTRELSPNEAMLGSSCRIWWYALAMFHSIGNALATILIVLGVIALRLLLPSPLTDKYMIRYLPKSWQRWLSGYPKSSAKNSH